MNFLDEAISFISPKRGNVRRAWRRALEEQRSYDAGNYRGSNTNWRAVNAPAELNNQLSRDTIRARARDLENNSDLMGAVIGAYKRNVIGGGYTLQAGHENEEINDELERLWKNWCKKQNCDILGTQSFNQILRMLIRRKKIDGGILIVKRYTKNGMIPLQIQVLEVDELDITQSQPKYKKNKVIGGIEINEFNKTIGYWIRQYSLDGFQSEPPIFLEEKEVVFYCSKARPSQVREISDMAPTITRIRDINEFANTISIKERVLACLAIFIKRVVPTGGIGRFGGDKEGKDNQYEGQTLSPGMIGTLNPGDEVQVVNPNGQATDATTYIKMQQRMIGAGQGISYEALARDMNETNYSSARQGAIEDELTFVEEKELLMEVMTEIYETFVISCVLAGKLQNKDFWENKDKYLKHEWVQAPKKWIDPLKEANANKVALQSGQKTFAQIAAENGKDWKEQINEISKIYEYAESLNINFDKIIYGARAIREAEKKEERNE